MSKYEKIELTNMCMIYDNNGNVLVQDKINKSWGGITFPGGHIEKQESFVDSVIREVKEETNLEIGELKLFGAADDIQPDRHYITLHIIAKKHRGELKVMEPTKEDRWEWFDLDKLPQNLYSPSKKFIEEYLK